jgi:RNA polymerase sigma-70 factor (family 1)
MEVSDDNKLLSQVMKNETKAFEIIFSRYWEKLYAFAFKMTLDQELSKIIVQNIFIDLWERRNKIQISNMEGYLIRSVKFQVFTQYRDKKMNREVLQDKFDDYIEDNQEILNHDLLNRLEKSLDKLPEKRGAILRMNKIQNLPIGEIALLLNISRQTVKNQLSQAVKQLKADLQQP